jgi:hypothetical protein
VAAPKRQSTEKKSERKKRIICERRAFLNVERVQTRTHTYIHTKGDRKGILPTFSFRCCLCLLTFFFLLLGRFPPTFSAAIQSAN